MGSLNFLATTKSTDRTSHRNLSPPAQGESRSGGEVHSHQAPKKSLGYVLIKL